MIFESPIFYLLQDEYIFKAEIAIIASMFFPDATKDNVSCGVLMSALKKGRDIFFARLTMEVKGESLPRVCPVISYSLLWKIAESSLIYP